MTQLERRRGETIDKAEPWGTGRLFSRESVNKENDWVVRRSLYTDVGKESGDADVVNVALERPGGKGNDWARRGTSATPSLCKVVAGNWHWL